MRYTHFEVSLQFNLQKPSNSTRNDLGALSGNLEPSPNVLQNNTAHRDIRCGAVNNCGVREQLA
ncbi:hypothetical protein PSAB6_180139 [Paraburkholderia sabiae]|nr:hypothetical protein PSAB6_180139 [Paraburkholderia sabiae]